MKEIIAPNPIKRGCSPRLFLAGSIEMGEAEDWQRTVVNKLEGLDVTIFNPRRKNWDPSWPQDPSFEPFKTQVLWEQEAMDISEIVIVNFVPGTISPITLLELGLLMNRWWNSFVFVCCPKEYARYGNVKITCELYDIKVYENLDDVVNLVSEILKECKLS